MSNEREFRNRSKIQIDRETSRQNKPKGYHTGEKMIVSGWRATVEFTQKSGAFTGIYRHFHQPIKIECLLKTLTTFVLITNPNFLIPKSL